MMDQAVVMSHGSPGAGAAALVLVLLRIAPFVALAPMFGKGTPTLVRAGLAVGLTAVVGPAIALTSPVLPSGMAFVVLCAKEVLLGAILGILVRFVIDLFATAGELADLSRGATLRNVLGPLHQDQASALGALFATLGICLIFATGGHLVILSGLFRWFTTLPISVLPDAGTLAKDLSSVGLAMVARLFQCALELAAPVVIAMALCDLALGLVGRVVTQVQVDFLGAGVRALLGLWVVLMILPAAASGFLENFLRSLTLWLAS